MMAIGYDRGIQSLGAARKEAARLRTSLESASRRGDVKAKSYLAARLSRLETLIDSLRAAEQRAQQEIEREQWISSPDVAGVGDRS